MPDHPRLPRAAAAALAVALLVQAHDAAGEGVLFPEPLSLRREVHDPIAGRVVVVEEYCSGNRVVAVAGARVAIADHGRQELTEIDHAARTFSITSFAEIARAQARVEQRGAPTESSLEGRALGSRVSVRGRPLDAYEFVRATGDGRQVVSVAVDPRLQLSAPALEALVGAAFPNRRAFVHEAMLRAAAGGQARDRRTQTASAAGLALPLEVEVTYESRGERITFRSAVVEVGQKRAPDEIVLLPPGARRVESASVSVPRLSGELDSPPRRP